MASFRRDKHLNVSRQLANPGQVGETVFGGPTVYFEPSKDVRITREPREISDDPQSELSLFGDSGGFSGFSGFSVPGKDCSGITENLELPRERTEFGEGVVKSSGNPFLTRTVHFARKTPPSPSSILPKKNLELEERATFRHFQYSSGGKESSEVVDFSLRKERGLVSRSSEPKPNLVLRRFREGMGSDSRDKRSIRPMEEGSARLAYKLQRTLCRSSSSKSLRDRGVRSSGTGQLGQHHSVGLYQETRGNSLSFSVPYNKRAVVLGKRKESDASHKICERREEHQSRQAKQVKPSSPHRMDPSHSGVSSSVVPVGQSTYRPIRHLPIQKDRELLLLSGRPESDSGGRHAAGLVRPRCLRLSPLQNVRSGVKKICGIKRDETNSHCSLLAVSRLVHRGTGMDSGLPKISSTQERSSQTTPFREVPSKPPRSLSDCLSTIERLFRARGFSSKASKAIARARRSSTIRVYQSKWDVFRRWCKKNKLSSSDTSVTNIADFLIFLREESKLSVSTIKGYRSMLSAVFRNRGLRIAEDKDLHNLIRSFETSKTFSLRTPNWNLDVVLRFLSSSRFEPPLNASFRDLTRKCIFLLSLATAKRISEIHALDSRVGFKSDAAICSFQTLFLAKNENPSKPWPKSFEVKGLSNLVGEELERSLCPVRALKFYLKKKNELNGCKQSLWCAVRDPSRPMSKRH
ncbi:uncharacterized protein LOC135214501 [Macrobrachium nipponense]|uniref:uncharacterized protein LOC135214501 n=1 Tax=Macrobrachium nipponense TaxID=159736 RepID=UPI0030C8CF62